MRYEILVGLHITDNEQYSNYRAAMKSILAIYDGQFGYDFTVSQVLKTPDIATEAEKKINRVFTLNFPTQDDMDSFFSNTDYLAVKEKYFAPSVGSVSIIASYQKAE